MLGYVHRGEPTMILHSFFVFGIDQIRNIRNSMRMDLLFWNLHNIYDCICFLANGTCSTQEQVFTRQYSGRWESCSENNPAFHCARILSLRSKFVGRSAVSHVEELRRVHRVVLFGGPRLHSPENVRVELLTEDDFISSLVRLEWTHVQCGRCGATEARELGLSMPVDVPGLQGTPDMQ